MSTTTISAASDALTDVQSRILAVQQRIAALSGAPIASTSAAASSDPSASTTFASSLAQAQALLSASSDASGTASTGSTGAATGDSIVADSLQYLGTPYQWGGTDPSTGLDCSGFTQRVMADQGISIPRTAAQQATAGTAVPSLAQAQPGDLVILDGGHHVGIYVGNNQMINSPKTGDVVKIEKIWQTPTAIRRVTSDAAASTSQTTMSTYLRQALLGSSTGTTDTSGISSLLGLDSSGSTSSGDLSSALGLGSAGSSTSSLLSGLGLSSLSGLSGLSSLAGLSGLSGTSAATTSGTSGVAGYQSLFDAATAKYGLPSGLLASVAQVESGGNPNAVSSAGASGLMQLMPSTAAGLGVDPTDPAQAVDGAARLLAANLKTFGTVPLALAAYNAGAGNVTKYGGIPPFAETQSYVTKVSTLMTGSAS